MKMMRLIKPIALAGAVLATTTSLAMTPLTLTIHNKTHEKMTLISTKLNRMSVDPDFWDAIDSNTFVPYVLKFDDNLTDIINDSAEINYMIHCPDGSKDKLTITAGGKVNQLKVISFSITVDKKITGMNEDSAEVGAHCSALSNPSSPIDIKDGVAEVVVIPAGK